MVDSNLQRESLLPSERAFAYKMKLDAMKRQAGRPSKENVSQVGTQKRSDQLLAEQVGQSRNQIQRYIRLTELIPELMDIRTEKGEFNRWIRATNAVIRDIKKRIASLIGWIADMKAELSKPQAPDLASLLNAYYTQRRAGAYSQKGKVSNLKEMNETFKTSLSVM